MDAGGYRIRHGCAARRRASAGSADPADPSARPLIRVIAGGVEAAARRPRHARSAQRCERIRPMDDADLQLRNATYGLVVDLGRAPTPEETARSLEREVADVRAGWARLHDAHALVLDAETGAILMANPFAAVPTRYRVAVGDRWWYANCAWDAFGICA